MEFEKGTLRNPAWILLRDLICERTGMSYEQNNLELIAGKISDLMAEQGIDSPLDYYYMLKYEKRSDEWQRLENAISVRETYFWREVDQIRALTDVLLPRLFNLGIDELRIWSAACASGEEPVSIAIALDQAGWFDRMAIEIHASDMSSAAICAARRGTYRERSFRALPAQLRDRYFTSAGNEWEVNATLRRRIVWHQANLTNPNEIAALARSRVIFCRNVFIYFSDSAIRNVLKTYAAYMPQPGFLFVAAAESLLKYSTQFNLQQIEGAFVYVRE